ncbi:MAG: hypothetical protein ACKODK_00565, partial [Opitutaceae bacterium]
HEALEVDGANRVELLFTPTIDQDVHAAFLRQISETDPAARHIIIQDQAGFHLQAAARDDRPMCAWYRCRPTALSSTRSKSSATW